MDERELKAFHLAVIRRCRETMEAYWLRARDDGHADSVVVLHALYDPEAGQFNSGINIEDRLVIANQLAEKFPAEAMALSEKPPADQPMAIVVVSADGVSVSHMAHPDPSREEGNRS